MTDSPQKRLVLEDECMHYWKTIIDLHEQELNLRRQKTDYLDERSQTAEDIRKKIFCLTGERLKKGQKDKEFAYKDYWKYTEIIYKNDPLFWLMQQHPLKTDIIEKDNFDFIILRYKTIFKQIEDSGNKSLNYKEKRQSQWAPTNLRSIRKIQSKMQLNKNSIYYSLGGGDGRDCLTAWHDYKVAKCVYIENNPLMADIFENHILPKYEEKFNTSNIEIICGDLFDQNISEATHAFISLSKLYGIWDQVNDLMASLNEDAIIASINLKLNSGFEDIDKDLVNILDSEIGQLGHSDSVYFQKRKLISENIQTASLAELFKQLIT